MIASLKTRNLLLIPFIFLLLSCAVFLGPRDVELPLAKLQQKVNQRFPLNNRYLEIFDVSFTNPQVSLLPETNRIRLALDSTIAPPFTSKRLQSSVALSGSLRFDSARNAIMLTDLKVDWLKLDGFDAQQTRQFAKFGTFLADQLFKDVPLYQFKPEDLQIGGTTITPTQITVKPDALVLRVVPQN